MRRVGVALVQVCAAWVRTIDERSGGEADCSERCEVVVEIGDVGHCREPSDEGVADPEGAYRKTHAVCVPRHRATVPY